ncbi:MAG: peptidase A24 [Lachnospiraceae bacterium]|nr:peptidase A24 [Lachnospiraceae bacterium]
MYAIRLLSAAILVSVAFGMDLHRHMVSNVWILFGWVWGLSVQYIMHGWGGVAQFLIGAVIPILWLFPLFYFRMLGPGDIKLLSVLGGLLESRAVIQLIILSFFLGGILSLGILIVSGTFLFRLRYFVDYFRECIKSKERRPYYKTGQQEENIHFTLPILLGVFLYVGGIY